MLSSISETFKYGDQEIRVVGGINDPWFLAKDVFDALSMSWAGAQSLSKIKDDWKMTQPTVDPLGRTQEAWYLNESGLYKLAFRSNKPEAEKFTEWVASEVLPSIRKTGSYANAPVLSAAELILAQAQQLVEQERKIKEHDERLAKLEADAAQQKAIKAEAEKEILALPPASAAVPEETLDMKIRRLVNSYCYGASADHQLIWRCLYRQFELRYHRKITAKGKESKLQAVVRMGSIGDLYDLAYTLLRPDEEGHFSGAVTSF